MVERPLPSLVSRGQILDKVKLPDAPGRIFSRRRYRLGSGAGSVDENELSHVIETIKSLQNDHIVSYWGSYSFQGYAYILMTPCCDYTLRNFLATSQSTFKALPKKQRRELVMNWILCLVDTVCFLHSRDQSHCYIKPSTVLFDKTATASSWLIPSGSARMPGSDTPTKPPSIENGTTTPRRSSGTAPGALRAREAAAIPLSRKTRAPPHRSSTTRI